MKATLWQAKVRDDLKWVVAYSIDGKRIRKYFDREADAEKHRNELAGDQDAVGAQWALVPPPERRSILLANDAARKAGLDLFDCVRRCLNLPPPTHQAPPPSTPKKSGGKTLKEVAMFFLETKAAGWRQKYREEMTRSIQELNEAFGALPIDEVTTDMIEHWLKRWTGASTRNTKYDHAKIVYNYAIKREWCLRNPCAPLDKIVIDQKMPAILTVHDCERLMQSSPRDMIGYFTLCLFGGVRPNEALGITWDKIDLNRGIVTIDGSVSKTHQARHVHLPENAVAWLRGAKGKGKHVSPSKTTVDRRRRELAASLKIDWDQNVLRHTAASMLMGIGKTSAEVTDLLGNSRDMLYKHYRALVTREQAEAFFNIMPFKIAAA